MSNPKTDRHLQVVEDPPRAEDIVRQVTAPLCAEDRRPKLPTRDLRKDIAAEDLFREYLRRLDYIDQELEEVKNARADLLTEFKRDGFDPAALKEALKFRKLTPSAREDFLGNLRTYTRAMDLQLEFPFAGQYPLRWGLGSGL